jgi:hypothetical protein
MSSAKDAASDAINGRCRLTPPAGRPRPGDPVLPGSVPAGRAPRHAVHPTSRSLPLIVSIMALAVGLTAIVFRVHSTPAVETTFLAASRPQPARDTRGRGAATARGQRRGRRSRGHAALRRPALMMLGRLGYSTLTPADGRQRRRTLRPASPRDERSAARLKMPWMGSRAAFAQMHAHRARGPGAALLRVRAERRGAKPDLGGSYRPAIEAVPRGPSRTHVRASGSDDSALSTQRCPPGASRVPCHHGLASVASARAAASWRGAWCPSVARVRRRR